MVAIHNHAEAERIGLVGRELVPGDQTPCKVVVAWELESERASDWPRPCSTLGTYP